MTVTSLSKRMKCIFLRDYPLTMIDRSNSLEYKKNLSRTTGTFVAHADGDITSGEVGAVELLDGSLGVVVGAASHEAIALAPSVVVADDTDGSAGNDGLKECGQIIFIDVE